MIFPADAASLAQARQYVSQWLARHTDRPLAWRNDVVIAAGEVLQNIIRHERYARPPARPYSVRLTVTSENSVFLFIKDKALPLHDQAFLRAQHQPSETGGMGLRIVFAVCMAYRIVPRQNGNLHLLQF